MVTISLCMIVKNEENNLERCLKGLVSLMDEIIIVDTGSTDRTVEIAESYTEQVYHFSWCDDFSAARNYAVSKATKDYIYMADADEVLDEENQERFLQLKQTLLPEIEIVQMMYTNQLSFGTTYNFDEEYRPKLWKRLRSFEFIDPIHETLRLSPVIYDSEIRIIHKPHESHADRDFRAFEKICANKLPLSSKLHNMYARELFISGTEEDFLAAQDYFYEQYEKEPDKESMAVLSHCFRIGNRMEDFFTVCLKDVATTGSSEVCFELGKYYETHGRGAEALIWYYNAAFEAEPILDIRCGKQLPLQALIRVCEALGDEEAAAIYRRTLDEVLGK